MKDLVAVISGDIINSSKLSSDERHVLETFLWDELKRLSGSEDNFSIDRGDAFQLKVTDPAQALTKAIALRSLLKSTFKQKNKARSDTRISIGIGREELQGRTVSSSDGEVYRLSGHGLDILKNSETNLAITTGQEIWDATWMTISYLIDEHITSWSPLQAEAILLRLQQKTYEQIGTTLGINTSAAFKRIESAHWKSVEKAVDYYKFMIEKIKTST